MRDDIWGGRKSAPSSKEAEGAAAAPVSRGPNIYTVTQVNRYIHNMFAQDYLLKTLRVRGEVSNVKYHQSGHIYFSLKDEGGAMACVMFAGNRKGLSFPMRDGDQVVILGTVDVFERDGRYQLYAKTITREGAGGLYERFLALKNTLEEMGMFSPRYKKPIPRYVRRLGIVTAPTGAAIQDIRNISARRDRSVTLILYPALVQGEGAAQSVVRGIRLLDQAGVDVIIVGRGGGSIEDLWAFNEEAVARAIFECRTPIISAVGHETDFTIADFVADMRAPTPSAAAEIAVSDRQLLLDTLKGYEAAMAGLMRQNFAAARQALKLKEAHLLVQNPENRLRDNRQRLSYLSERLDEAIKKKLLLERQRLSLYAQRLEGCSPLKALASGYAYVEDEGGHPVSGVKDAKKGDALSVIFKDGALKVRVEDVSFIGIE